MEECWTRDRGVVGSSLTGVTVFVLEQSKKEGKDQESILSIKYHT